MAVAGTTWGPAEGSSQWFRVGIGFSTPTSGGNFYVYLYVDDQYGNTNDTQKLTWSGDASGSKNFSNTGGEILVERVYVNGSPGGRYTFTASLSGVYNGATPSHTRSINVPAQPPSAPRGLEAINVGRTSFRANWDPPSDDGGSPVTSYQVSLDGDYRTTTAGHLDYSGQAPGSEHFINVRARNSEGYGPWAGRVYFTMSPDAPEVPARPDVSNVDSDSAVVSWSAPKNNGATIDNYKVVLHKDGAFLRAEETTSRSVTWTDLDPNADYRSAVTAHNSEGWSGYSSYVNWTTSAAPPEAPINLTVSQVMPTSFRLSWDAPTFTGGLSLIGYRVQVATDGSFNNLVYNTYLDSTSRVRDISGLDPDTVYYARVRAANSAYNGPYSATTSASTAIGTPGAPLNPTITDLGATTVTLTWDPPTSDGGGAIDHYRVELSSPSKYVTTPSTQVTVEGLTPGEDAWLRVQAHNSAGYGPWSTRVYLTTLSGLRVGDGTSWRDAVLHVGDGTSWRQAVPYVGDGTNWRG